MTSGGAGCLEDDAIGALVRGGLAGAELEQVEAHLADCNDCALLVAAAALGLGETLGASRHAASSSSGTGRASRLARRLEDTFELFELVGRGAMGAVYRGRERSTGQVVAIKLLDPRAAPNRRDVLRFLREMKALERLQHPNIVRLRGAMSRSDDLALIMEYAPKGTLRQLLRDSGRLPLRRSLEVTLELSDALARAHHVGVIHRDVKPDNVLFAEDGSPRLADFGLARLAEDPLTTDNPLVGTVPYLSPETIDGATTDAKADVWALGVMLFEMLAGRRPFAGDTPAATFAAILRAPLPDLREARPELSPAVADLVRRLLERDRGERPTAREAGAAIERAIGSLDVSARPAASAPPPSTSSPGSRRHFPRTGALPVPTTPFIGRKTELEHVVRLLESPDARSVTVLGPGGMGKTRLAIEVGRRFDRGPPGAAFADGVRFVDLTRIATADLIAGAVGAALAFVPTSPAAALQQVIEHLRDKRMLLVLDNFEHVASGAGLVSQILEAAAGVKVLATSREALNLGSETRVHLDGLRRARHGEEAIDLFIDVARRASQHELREQRSAIAHICDLVDGSPLGIILAASWTDSLSPPEIADEVARSLDFLQTDRRDLPDRQRSLRAVFSSTWALLSDAERDVFARLSVFRGGFQRRAAVAVANATAPQLAALSAKSLITWHPVEGRYRVHELLRQYGEEARLAEPARDEHTRQQLAGYVARLLQQRKADLQGPRQRDAIVEMEHDAANIREGWRWMLAQGRIEDVDASIWGLLLFHYQRGARGDAEAALADVARAFEPFEAHGAIGAKLGSMVFSFMGILADAQWRTAVAADCLERAERLARGAGPSVEHGLTLVAAAGLVGAPGAWQERVADAERGLQMVRAGGPSWELAFALMLMARVASKIAKAPERAESLLLESVDAQREAFGEVVLPSSLGGIGALRRLRGDFVGALASTIEATRIADSLADRWSIQDCLQLAAEIQLDMGDVSSAEASVRRCIELSRERGSPAYLSWCHTHLGDIESARGRMPLAEASYRRARDSSSGDSLHRAVAELRLAELAAARGEHEPARRDASRCLTLFERSGSFTGILSASSALAAIACQRGQLPEAIEHCRRALLASLEVGHARGLLEALLTSARLGLAKGDPRGLQLCEVARAHPLLGHPLRARVHASLPEGSREQSAEHAQRPIPDVAGQIDLVALVMEELRELDAPSAAAASREPTHVAG